MFVFKGNMKDKLIFEKLQQNLWNGKKKQTKIQKKKSPKNKNQSAEEQENNKISLNRRIKLSKITEGKMMKYLGFPVEK